MEHVALSSDAVAIEVSEMRSGRKSNTTATALVNVTELPLHGLRRKVAESDELVREATYELVVELLTTALFTTVASSIVTARAQGRSLRFLGPASAYFPAQPEALNRLKATSSYPFFDPTLTSHLSRTYDQLRFIRTVTPIDAEVWTADGTVTAIDIEQLRSSWQSLTGQFRMILLALTELDLLLWPDQTSRLYEIEGIAKAARYGGTPCVRADGVVFVPSWLDHRRETRVPVGVTVWVESIRGRHRAVLNNFSISGFGLSSSPSLEIGSTLTVELPDKRRFSGGVIWCHGGNVGMRLDQPLAEKDPLFAKVPALRRLAKSGE